MLPPPRPSALLALLLLVSATSLPRVAVADAPDPAISSFCQNPCTPLKLPPDASPQGMDVGSVLAKVFVGMVEAIVDVVTDVPGEGELLKPFAKIATGALLPLVDPAVAAFQEDPLDKMERSIQKDMVQMQDFLACTINSVVGKAVDDIVSQMNEAAVQAFDANIAGLLQWFDGVTCKYNCLNYTQFPPSQRNCAAGTDCVAGTPSDQCAGYTKYRPFPNNKACTVAGQTGECDTDGQCYIGVTWFSVIQEIRTQMDLVFVSNSVIAGLNGGNAVTFDEVTDMTSLVAYAKGVMLKTVLYQTRIMLGEAGGINSEFGQFAQFASKQLQRRLAYYSGDYLRRILLKFSTPTVFNQAGAWGKVEEVLGGGLPSTKNYSSVLPGYFEMQAYTWELPYLEKMEVNQANWQEVARRCYFGSISGYSGVNGVWYWKVWQYPQVDPIYRYPDLCGSRCDKTTLQFELLHTYQIQSSCNGPTFGGRVSTPCSTKAAPSHCGREDSCANAWLAPGYCKDKTTAVFTQCMAGEFWQKAKADFNKGLASLQAQLAPALDTLRNASIALANMSDGLPAVLGGMYQKEYYPYKKGCPVRKDYCSGGKVPQIPAPSKPVDPTAAVRSNICRQAPFNTMCPGSACNRNVGCTRCPKAAAPLLLPNADKWHWTCNSCRALNCASGACTSQGCTACAPGWFLAGPASSRASAFRLAYSKTSGRYATCRPCAAPAPIGYGTDCARCTERECTLCASGLRKVAGKCVRAGGRVGHGAGGAGVGKPRG